MRGLVVGMLLVAFAPPVRAHLVPLDPSTCAATLGLSAPASALVATVAPPAADERLRVAYAPGSNPDRSRMQVCHADPAAPATRCGSPVARPFTLGPVAGSLVLPAAFDLRLLADGEMPGVTVPVTIDAGGGPVVVSFALGSAFVPRGVALDLGRALGDDGTFAIAGVGRSDALPAPLGGTDLVLELGCTLAPAPDRDQFAQGPRIVTLRGVASPKRLRLVVGLETAIGAPPEFAGVPTRLLLRGDAGTLLEAVLPQGLAADGSRRHTGATDDGAASIVVTELARRTTRAYRVRITAPPPAAGTGPALLAIETGGLFVRHAVVRKGKRLVLAR